MICPRSNIERISEVFLDFVRVNKQFEMPRLFRLGPSQIAMIRSTLHYFENLRTQSYGYVKYRISNPSKKRRETDTQFQVSKQNSILDLIDTYRILRKAVFDESRMYGLEGDLSYLSRSTLQYGAKKPK
uniref:Uncharacterized protein n=1 Tax=Lotus japonicus TaxID=34305 RepID=I3T972_LOTJA|nr:unknown [Lotus japonicus]